ncbi:hypothetical protein LINGRAHAP2_LOCUS15824 [Linum grandiflorum]
MFDATKKNDRYSLHAIGMSKRVFQKLCKELVDIGGLKGTNNVEVDEMVVMFLHTLGHNVKNRILQQHFGRSAMPRKKKDEKKKDENNEEKERPYFSWNDELDQILVNSMMMLVESRKIDSKGKFVAGSYLLLEDMIERAKPGCGVKADPNIMSRVKTLKQKFLAVQELRGLSGAGWDETLKMVILDDHVFAEYVQNHKHCAKLNKNEEAEFVAVDDDVPPTTPTDKAQQSDATSRPKKVRRTTKSAPATDEGDELKPILKAAVNNLQSMTGQSEQTNNLKDNLFAQVEKVEGISADDAVDAAFKIVKDADLLRLFYSMISAEARKRLIQRVLREP